MPTGEPAALRPVRRGFTYLGVLLAMALVAAAAAGWAQHAALAQRRERERELLFRGAQIARAIAAYRAASADGGGPQRLEDLLDDRRGASPRHHLRQLWADPFTGRADWALLVDAERRIVGVHSRAGLKRLLQTGGPPAEGPLLSDWRFEGGAP